MARNTETRCVCDARIHWVPSAEKAGEGAWVHTDGPQRGSVNCYASDKDIVAEPADINDLLVAEEEFTPPA